MKLKLFLLLLLPLQLFARTSHLNGTVIDAASHLPVKGAKAFINRSMEFAISDSLGKFSLIDTLSLPVELVVTMPGYETLLYFVKDAKPTLQLRFELVKKKHAFGPIDSTKLLQYEDIFLRHFFGITYNVRETFIANPSVLRYRFDEASGTLSVTSNGLVDIINDGLGYMIHYQLDTFSLNIAKNLSDFSGYCFFTQLKTQKPFIISKWDMRRQLAYNGSMLHFIRTLKKNTISDEGFIIRKVLRILETENGYKAALRSKYLVRSGVIPGSGTPTSYAEVTDQKPLTLGNFGRRDSANLTYFHYDHPLLVEWVDKASKTFLSADEIPQIITLLSFGKNPLQVFENGLYFDTADMFVQGFMQEKISDLLPLEYVKL